MKNNSGKLAQEWFGLAENELGYAKLGLKYSDKFYSQVCIQCHQAVEKYLKGFLAYHGKKPARIHDLVKLLNDCTQIDKDSEQFLDDCRKITDYYVILRYPITVPPRTKEEAEQVLQIASSIEKFVLERCS